MTYFHDSPANVNHLGVGMPLPMVVAKAWLLNEGQEVNNPTNPLNILYYGTNGQVGKLGRFGVYRSAFAGLDAAASTIHRLIYYAGARRAIQSWIASPHDNARIINVARAIEDSPWAGGHYGGGGARDGNIVRYARAHLPGPTTPTSPVRVRLTITQLTPVYAAPFGPLIGHVSKATYDAIRSTLINPHTGRRQHWFQVIGATSAIRGKWLPAEPWFTYVVI